MARLFLVFLICLGGLAQAHGTGESYVYFSVDDESLTGRFEARVVEIGPRFGLDPDGDGIITLAEAEARGAELFAYFSDRLTLSQSAGGAALALSPGPVALLGTERGQFLQIGFTVDIDAPVPDTLSIHYQPMTDIAPTQLGYGLIENNTRTGITDNEGNISIVFRDNGPEQTLYLAGEPWDKVFRMFIAHGVWHIWLGFDHVVFLITLLLPAVMMVQAGRWAPETAFSTAFWNVLKIVTLFTISHSITLSLAALGIITLPVTFVEAIIAVSIAVVAILNMFPSAHRHVLWVVFGFGLFHGFGFANVLAPLGVDPTQKLVGLAAFNIGVEIGQVAIVLVAFPLLWLVRRWWLYPPLALKLGSVCLVLLAGVWLLERTTDFNWDTRGTIRFLTGMSL